MDNDTKFIEKGFPCHQVGAETARERNTGKAPPTHRLHVWWARRPLIPSRAAVLGSLLPSDSDPGKFLLDLGIRKLVNGESKFIPANPAGAKEQILKAKESGIKLSPEESYGYRRAFLHIPLTKPREEKKILDPMAGGGSIPFEALRLGHFVYTNELNPVATVILHATLKYPSMFGEELAEDIEDWGEKIYQELLEKTDRFYPEHENEDIKAFLYVREIICPSCHNWSPLFNNKYLSKAAGNIWGVEIVPETPEVSFRCVKFENAASCQDLKKGTILRGTAQCVHCNQAIPGEEIKKQARGESRLGKWRERIYAISFTRMIPTGKFYKTGVKKGQEKFKLERSFRTPDSTDVAALKETERFIQTKMEDWLDSVLIPTERIPPGNDIRPVLYGMTEWRHLFTPRQLLCHVTLVETLNKLKPDILEDLGKEKGKAVITYLQFAIDKGLDYNSRQTRWVPQRGIITGTFARHDFSIKWTFGEMIASKMFKWGLKQVTDAYREICYLLNEESLKSPGKTPLTITNFPGDHLPFLQDKAIDIICTDPPYYDNVQYAELSDYFYVWQKRTLKDLYPDLFSRTLTDKRSEAVASVARFKSRSRISPELSPRLKARQDYENKIKAIFRECHRVLKDDGIMTLMFTHKREEAWESIAMGLIESGWVITSSFPVDTEFEYSTHIREKAAATSTIFLTARKKRSGCKEPASWSGLGNTGVKFKLRKMVKDGLKEFRKLDLNEVDILLASYGRALHALSSEWPVLDGDELVTPSRAIFEASLLVAESRFEEITEGRLNRKSLDNETAMAVFVLSGWGIKEVRFDVLRKTALALALEWVSKSGNYPIKPGEVAFCPIKKHEYLSFDLLGENARKKGVYSSFVKYGNVLRLVLPEQKHPDRLENPLSDWDRLYGIIMGYRKKSFGGIEEYIARGKIVNLAVVGDLLKLWGKYADDEKLRQEARNIAFFLRQQVDKRW